MQYDSYFFVGIAGTGMSALAQYVKGKGCKVAGSDRLFSDTTKQAMQVALEQQGIECFYQDGRGIDKNFAAVVISTAIEDKNVELRKARKLGIPVIKRSELLAEISENARTIAVAGTSGKSTTTAMIFEILHDNGLAPSLITGAPLSSLQQRGLVGNAYGDTGEWLVIEADESDGSIVNYHPEISVLLNVERDHKDEDELIELFETFRDHTQRTFIVNDDYEQTRNLSQERSCDFGTRNKDVGFFGSDFVQDGFSIRFKVNGIGCDIPMIGRHNMENALAAIAACYQAGVSIEKAISTLAKFGGIYRRSQTVGIIDDRNICVIDDFAHNPSEVAAAIKACQRLAPTVMACFFPHGFGPLRFMKDKLAEEVSSVLREKDYFFITDVYYAGGTVDRDVEPDEVSEKIADEGKNALFTGDKESTLLKIVETTPKDNAVVLIMGARDPYLSDFARKVYFELSTLW